MSNPDDPTTDSAVPEVETIASASAPARTPSQCAIPENAHPKTYAPKTHESEASSFEPTAALQNALDRPPPPDHAYKAKRIRRALTRSKAAPRAEALALQAHILHELFLDYLLENASSGADVNLALRAQKQFMNAFQALENKENKAPEITKI